MLPEVAGGQLQGRAQEPELHLLGLERDRQDAQPHALVDTSSRPLPRIGHHDCGCGLGYRGCRSQAACWSG